MEIVRRLGWAIVTVLLAAGCAPDASPAPTPVPTPSGPPSCPAGLVLARVYPPDRTEVRLRVLSVGDQAGRAAAVGKEFRDRGLQVVATDSTSERYDGVVILRYGPKAVGAAWDVMPFFGVGLEPDVQWRNEFQLTRADDVVDVVLGRQFRQLATITEVNQATARLALPTAPPGTCASPHSE